MLQEPPGSWYRPRPFTHAGVDSFESYEIVIGRRTEILDLAGISQFLYNVRLT